MIKGWCAGEDTGVCNPCGDNQSGGEVHEGWGGIGIGIGGVSSLLAVQEVCVGDSGAACERVRFTEGGKFVGSTVGGALGARIAQSASGPICLALGVTGVGAVACVATVIGIGARMGTTGLGEGGEKVGEILYEKTQP